MTLAVFIVGATVLGGTTIFWLFGFPDMSFRWPYRTLMVLMACFFLFALISVYSSARGGSQTPAGQDTPLALVTVAATSIVIQLALFVTALLVRRERNRADGELANPAT